MNKKQLWKLQKISLWIFSLVAAIFLISVITMSADSCEPRKDMFGKTTYGFECFYPIVSHLIGKQSPDNMYFIVSLGLLFLGFVLLIVNFLTKIFGVNSKWH